MGESLSICVATSGACLQAISRGIIRASPWKAADCGCWVRAAKVERISQEPVVIALNEFITAADPFHITCSRQKYTNHIETCTSPALSSLPLDIILAEGCVFYRPLVISHNPIEEQLAAVCRCLRQMPVFRKVHNSAIFSKNHWGTGCSGRSLMILQYIWQAWVVTSTSFSTVSTTVSLTTVDLQVRQTRPHTTSLANAQLGVLTISICGQYYALFYWYFTSCLLEELR